jgi:hypothetical protein
MIGDWAETLAEVTPRRYKNPSGILGSTWFAKATVIGKFYEGDGSTPGDAVVGLVATLNKHGVLECFMEKGRNQSPMTAPILSDNTP